MKTKKLSFLSLFIVSSLLFQGCVTKQKPEVYQTIHGELTIEDPLAKALIKHANFQRLKGIQQHGLNHKTLGEKGFNRFEHSIGVYALLKKHGASRPERIAGLLHDVSHTAFSHVGDHFFGHIDGKESWQDIDHENFLKQSGLAKIVEDYGMTLKEALPKSEKYKRLEQDLPDLCADRLNYVLHGASILNLLTKERIREIDDSLVFDVKKQTWYFKDISAAYDFSQASMWQTENTWGGSPEEFIVTKYFIQALRKAISLNLIKGSDFRWGTDNAVWSKLDESTDKEIKTLMAKVKNPKKHYLIKKSRECKAPYCKHRFKLRIVNPYVLNVKNEMVRLTEAKKQYAQNFSKFKSRLANGRCLELV